MQCLRVPSSWTAAPSIPRWPVRWRLRPLLARYSLPPHTLKTLGMAHSPSSVALTQARMVDAPVSGGVGGAEAATLTFMVGGR